MPYLDSSASCILCPGKFVVEIRPLPDILCIFKVSGELLNLTIRIQVHITFQSSNQHFYIDTHDLMPIVLHVTPRIIWHHERQALALRDETRLKSRCFH
jgi:hypothetical protein